MEVQLQESFVINNLLSECYPENGLGAPRDQGEKGEEQGQDLPCR